MNLLFALIQTFAIGFLGFILSYTAYQHGFGMFSLKGRMNRLQFSIWFLITTAGLYILDNLIGSSNSLAMDWVVSLPTYYAILALHLLGCILLMPFLLITLIRRLQDIGLPSTCGYILAFLFMLPHNYTFIEPENYLIGLGQAFLILLLICVPGSEGSNTYGLPSLWPYKLDREPGRRKRDLDAFKAKQEIVKKRKKNKKRS